MGRKWKRWQALNTVEESKMIEHTIQKYTIPTYYPVQTQQYQPATNTTHVWTKEKFDAYLEELKTKGFVVGAKVITKYKMEGTILRYRECPPEGVTFYYEEKPSVFVLSREDGLMSSLLYVADELTLVK